MATTSWFTNASGSKTALSVMVTAGVANQDVIEITQAGGEHSTRRLQFAKSGQTIDPGALTNALAREAATGATPLPTTDAAGQGDRPDPAKVGGTVPAVTGSRAAPAALLLSLTQALQSAGIIKDNTTA